LGGGQRGESAVKSANRSAGGGNDDYVGHGKLLKLRYGNSMGLNVIGASLLFLF
jgi:hypothetical protein